MARRDRPDHYSMRARKEGFSARSVYKLQEIQQKHHVLRRGSRVLDVGAAPGSWSQWAHTVVGAAGMIVAVDLQELPDLEGTEGITTITGDIYEEDILAQIDSRAPYDAVISDAAPHTTGNRSVDTARSAALVEHIISLCPRYLKGGGAFVAKLFQGGDERALLALLRSMFTTARIVKPRATRSESFEVFLVGTGYNS